MYGEQGNKLVVDAKRIQSLPHLPMYAATTVRAVTKEVRDIDREVSSLLAPYSTASSQFVVDKIFGSQKSGSKALLDIVNGKAISADGSWGDRNPLPESVVFPVCITL